MRSRRGYRADLQKAPVAVGTACAGGPPHRSQRAGLPHWAPASGASVEARFRVGVQDLGRWEPSSSEAVHPLPVQAMTLAAAPERLEPATGHLIPEGLDRPAVAWHGVVGEVSSQHACQPSALLGDGQMPAAPELVIDLLELGPHPFSDRDAPEPELPAPALPADVREAQEIERLRLPQTACRPGAGGVPPELDEARLAGMQLQGELREPFAKIGEELPGVTMMLEPDNEVIRETHDDHVTKRIALPPPLGPQVQDIVQVHVGEQRRSHAWYGGHGGAARDGSADIPGGRRA